MLFFQKNRNHSGIATELPQIIGNGVPLAAVVTTSEIAQAFTQKKISIHLLVTLLPVQQGKLF